MSQEPAIESILDVNVISGKDASSDGKFFSYVVSRVYTEFKKPPENKIIFRNNETGTEEVVVQSEHQLSLPKFSPDGGFFSYIKSKDNIYHMCIRNLRSKTEFEIKCPESVIDYRWGVQEDAIILTNPETKGNEEKADDGHFFEESAKKNRLYNLKLTEGFSEIAGIPQVWEFDFKGKNIFAVASDSPREGSWFENYIAEIRMDGTWTKIYKPESGQVALPSLSRNSGRLSFVESIWSDRGVTSGDLMLIETNSYTAKNLSLSGESSYSCSKWDENDDLLAISQEEENFLIEKFHSNGTKAILWKKRGSVGPGYAPDFSYAPGQIFIDFTDYETPTEIVRIDTGKNNEMQVSSINEKLRLIKSYEWKTLSWKSKDGLEISGFIRNPGKNMPTIVVVHGGPTGSIKETFLDRYSFLLAEGYSIFMPNFRGSIGRGRTFAGLNYGDMGGMDLQDILSGIDFLIEEGYTDKKKIAITGGSYGGFMTQWAITQAGIFKSAIALFGISDWVSFHGGTNIPEWDEIQYDQKALDFDKFVKFSPLRYVKNIQTPLLIMHGESDPSVPPGQSFQFYRALKENGKDVRLLLFPREGHGFTEKEHILQSLKETLNFLKKTIS